MASDDVTNDSDPDVPANPSAAERADSLLDGQTPTFDDAGLSSEERRDLADQMWLSSLLAQLLDPGAKAHREALIQKVMQSIEHDAPPAVVGRESVRSLKRRSWLATAASLAALLLLGVYLFGPQAGPKTAMAAVERSLQAASEDVDRQYRIQMSLADGEAKPPITLTVRGARQFVWEQPVPNGVFQVGANGKDFWIIPALGPVVVAEEGSRLERFLARVMQQRSSTPILNIATALEWLRDRYELEMLPREEVPSSDPSEERMSCVHYRGRLQVRAEWFLPETMEIWSHPETGVVYRAVMTWPGGLPSGVRRAELQLAPPPRDLPVNWYEHAAHHDGQRLVITRRGGKLPAAEEAADPQP